MDDLQRATRPTTPSSYSGGVDPAGRAATVGTASGVSWGAIFAGAAGAAALSLILLVLGTGLGMSAVSPWSSQGVSATTFGVSTIVWISLTSLLASGMGGYLAGRLRSRWAGAHHDEVYFRDTAHGFLSWAIATLVTVAFLTSAIGSILGTGAQVGGSAVSAAGSAAATAATGAAGAMQGASSPAGAAGPTGYFVDTLFRSAPMAADASASAASGAAATSPVSASSRPPVTPQATQEVTRIFVRSLQNGSLADDDSRYLAQIVAQQTGIPAQDAQRRVTDVYTKAQTAIKDAETTARNAADKARAATAYGSLWLFVSLLLGAFTASLMATFGGRQRDL